MIRVNMLRNTGIGQAGGLSIEAASTDAKRAVLYRLIVIMLFPLSIYIFELLNLRDQEADLKDWRAKVEKLQAEKAKYGDAAPRIEKAAQQKALVEKKLEAMRAIAQSRLREVKTLDALQTITPPKTWIKHVAIDGNSVVLEGFSATSEGVTDFIRALDSSVFFSKVEPKRTSEEVVPGGGTVKKFELGFQIGKSE
jgi:hypothetical protein